MSYLIAFGIGVVLLLGGLFFGSAATIAFGFGWMVGVVLAGL